MYRTAGARRAPAITAAVLTIISSLTLLTATPAAALTPTAADTVQVRGNATFYGASNNVTQDPIVAIAAKPDGSGYWQVNARGGVFAFGSAGFYGSPSNIYLNKPVVAMFSAPAGTGYSIVTADGGMFHYGSAVNYGSAGGFYLNQPIVAAVPTSTGNGYYLLTADGGLFTFGNAPFYGSAGGTGGAARAVGMALGPNGQGYWILFNDGSVRSYGSASAFGGAAATTLNPAVALAGRRDGSGYWIVLRDGTIVARGAATAFGKVTHNHPLVGAASTAANGLWLTTHGNVPPTITGRVTKAGGQPAGYTCVAAEVAGGGGSFQTTDANGYYTMRLAKGTYTLRFSDCLGQGDLIEEYWDDKPTRETATPIVLGYGQHKVANADLAVGGRIRGVLTDGFGQGAPGVCVEAHDGSGAAPRRAVAGMTGMYEVRGLPTGAYRVRFTDCEDGSFADEWWDDKPTRVEASVIRATVGTTVSGIDAVLSHAGAISGNVTVPGTGTYYDYWYGYYGQRSVCVDAFDESGDNLIASTHSSITGHYNLGGLRSGRYKVRFAGCEQSGFLPEWNGDAYDSDGAPPIEVEDGLRINDVDATVTEGGVVEGRVASDAGNPLYGACVDAYDAGGNLVGTASAYGQSASYRLTGLRSGTHTARFRGCEGGWYGEQVAPEWYANQPTRTTATQFTVREGATRLNINGFLSPGGAITGVVKDTSARGLGGICVDAFDSAGDVASSSTTSVTGLYKVNSLAGGTYKVRFTDCVTGTYLERWFDAKGTQATANPVTVNPGSTTPNVNATLSKAGTVSGTVTGPGGAVAPMICVTAHTGSGAVVAEDVTSVSGTYRLGGLRTSQYRIRFADCHDHGYGDEWYADQPTFATATRVSVAQGAATTGISAQLLSDVPGAPQGVAAVPQGSGKVLVSWSPPAEEGASPVDGYLVSVSPGGWSTWVDGGGTTSAVFTGLTPGTTYTAYVNARNDDGVGAASPHSSPFVAT